MTDTIDVTSSTEPSGGPSPQRPLGELAAELLARADSEGVSLVGPGGLLAGLTKTVLETALEAEMTEHLGYEAYDPAGHHSGNSRNGTRSKTVLTEIGPVELEVPRDRDGSFEPVIVPKRRRRLSGVEDEMVCALSARGLTHGEISAYLAEVYDARVSKETISRITDRVMEGMTAWQNRPLDRVYPVIFIDAIVVKIREGQVANRPIYLAIGVTVDGERDILGIWAGDGGEGAKYWAQPAIYPSCGQDPNQATATHPLCVSGRGMPALPPGHYQVQPAFALLALPVPPPIDLTITAAASASSPQNGSSTVLDACTLLSARQIDTATGWSVTAGKHLQPEPTAPASKRTSLWVAARSNLGREGASPRPAGTTTHGDGR